MVLGRNFRASFASRFGGRLHVGSFTKTINGALDPSHAAAAPSQTTETYEFDGYAFAFEESLVDGEHIHKADYQVMILRGTIIDEDEEDAFDAMPTVNDTISIPPPGGTTPLTATIVRIAAITEAFITVNVRGESP